MAHITPPVAVTATAPPSSNEPTQEQARVQVVRLLKSHQYIISISLCEAAFARTDINDIVHDVVGLFRDQRLTEFICRTLQKEIETTEQPNHLLRRDCLATKVLAAFARTKAAQAYLRDTLQAPLLELINSKMHITPEGLSDPVEGEKNLQRLRATCQMLLLAIVNSHTASPQPFREICAFMKERVALRNCTDTKTATTLHEHQSTSAFLFLRFFCPAILTPHSFKLTKDAPDPETSKMLLLVSKVLTQIANGGGFDRGDLQHLNAFVETCQPMVQEFFSNMDRPLPPGLVPPPGNGSLKGVDLLSSREGRLLDSLLRYLADGSLLDVTGLEVARACSNNPEVLRSYESFRDFVTRLLPKSSDEPKSSRRRSKLLEWLQKDDRERKEKEHKEREPKEKDRKRLSAQHGSSILKREPEVSDLLEETPLARKWLDELGTSCDHGARAKQLLSQLVVQHRSLQRDFAALQAAHSIQSTALSGSGAAVSVASRTYTEDDLSSAKEEDAPSQATSTSTTTSQSRSEMRPGRQQLQRSISFGQARIVSSDVIPRLEPPGTLQSGAARGHTSPTTSGAPSPRTATGRLAFEFVSPDALHTQVSPKKSPKERSPPPAMASAVTRSSELTTSAPIPLSYSQPSTVTSPPDPHDTKSERRPRARTAGTMDVIDPRDVIVQPGGSVLAAASLADHVRRGNERSSTSGSRLSGKSKSGGPLKEPSSSSLKKS